MSSTNTELACSPEIENITSYMVRDKVTIAPISPGSQDYLIDSGGEEAKTLQSSGEVFQMIKNSHGDFFVVDKNFYKTLRATAQN
jgi:hypothetical protein